MGFKAAAQGSDMAAKRPSPTLEILFEAPGLYPETIPVSTLVSALAAVQRLAEGDPEGEVAEEQQTSPAIGDHRSLRLVDV